MLGPVGESEVAPNRVPGELPILDVDGLVETKRGRGMFINAGARSLLLQGERQKFLGEEWPRVYATIQRLGLKAEELLNGANPPSSADASPSQSNSPQEEKPKP